MSHSSHAPGPAACRRRPPSEPVVVVPGGRVCPRVPRLPVTSVDGRLPDRTGDVALADVARLVPGAVAGNLASLTGRGNPADSGIPSDAARQAIAKAETAYQKPEDGVPKTDLSEGVQASLDLADTALQEHQDVSGKADKAAGATPGDLAGLDENGNLTDSGIPAAAIPAGAGASDPLATRSFVNSSVSTNTATFRGTYNLVTDLELAVAATQEQTATAISRKMEVLSISPDNNDYCFVQVPYDDTPVDPDHIERVDRYKCSVAESGGATTRTWAYEWSLNNSSFTAAQWAAINSGVTSGLVAKLGALPTAEALAAALAGKASTVDATLTEKYGDEWRISADKGPNGGALEVVYGVYISPTTWTLVEDGSSSRWHATGNPPADATSLSFNMDGTPVAATRFIGYQLGSQSDKPLATAAQGAKADAALPAADVVAPSTSASDSGKAADAKVTGDALAGKASKSDATLTPIYSNTPTFSEWDVEPATATINGQTYTLFVFDKESGGVRYWWLSSSSSTSGTPMAVRPYDPTATSLAFTLPAGFSPSSVTATRTRIDILGYQLGSQEDKPLASEAEAEALRTGKQSALSAQQLANIAAVSDALAFDATHSYAAGDPVVYNGTLYTFTTAHTGAWTGNDVSEVDIIARLAGKLDKSGGTMTGGLTMGGGNLITFSDSSGTRTMTIGINGDIFEINLYSYGRLVYTWRTPYNGGIFALASDLLTKLDATSAASAFSASSTYAVGDHVTYNGGLYRCTTAVTTAGAWTGSANWTADTMTDPDAVLDITSQNQLRVVAKDGTLLWAQGYDLASTSSATLACDAVNNFTFADGATSQAFTLPTAPSGKVGDFGLDIDNSANASAVTMTLTGLDTTFSIVVPKGESLNDMLSIAAGELARFYITLSSFRVNNLPTWHIMKQVVENGGATV